MDLEMMNDETTSEGSGNLLNMLLGKILPFWPLFLVLFIIGLIGAKVYLGVTTPLYASTAALIVNDEKKGVDESQLMESFNVFETKKIVENEIEVLRSKDLIKDVVLNLHLYAPIYKTGFFSDSPLYDLGPVQLRLRNPENSDSYAEEVKVAFKYDAKTKMVRIDDKVYALDAWFENPTGGSDIMFVENSGFADMEDASFYYSLVDPRRVTASILGSLDVEAANKSATVVRLSYLDYLPQRGNAILDQLIISYKNAAKENQNDLAANTLQFIEARIEEVQAELEGVEKELEKYRSSEGVIDLSEQGNLYLANVGNYDRRIGDINLQLSVLSKVENYVISKNTKTGIVPSTLGIDDPILSQLLQRLYDAEIEYEQLRKTTAENNPILVAVRNRIAQIRPSILENVRSQKSNLRASLENLSANSGKYNEALQVLPEQERQFVEITRRKKSISDLYDYLVQNRETTALSFAPTVGNVRVIEAAEASLGPVSPDRMFVYLKGVFAMLALGLLWVFGRELLNPKVLYRSVLESCTDISVLGELAYLNKPDDKRLIDQHHDIFITDQFRQLLSNMGIYDYNTTLKTLLITSSIAGEGKSYVSANLAITMALSGKKTALIDMDLRKAGVSALFNLSDRVGISDFLSGAATTSDIGILKRGDLFIFPSGKKAMNSSELVVNSKMTDFLHDLKQKFDCIILDTPPISMVSDAATLARLCDMTLITVRHDHTPKFIAQRMDENLQRKGFKNSALVFNGVKARGLIKPDYGYGYGSGYGYEAPLNEEPVSFMGLLRKKYERLGKLIPTSFIEPLRRKYLQFRKRTS